MKDMKDAEVDIQAVIALVRRSNLPVDVATDRLRQLRLAEEAESRRGYPDACQLLRDAYSER